MAQTPITQPGTREEVGNKKTVTKNNLQLIIMWQQGVKGVLQIYKQILQNLRQSLYPAINKLVVAFLNNSQNWIENNTDPKRHIILKWNYQARI